MARDLVTDPVTLVELDEGKVMETGLKEVSRHSGLVVLAVSGMYKNLCAISTCSLQQPDRIRCAIKKIVD